MDLKSTKAEVERLKTEKAAALAELTGLKQQNSLLEVDLKAARNEVKEYRFRETRLLTDYSELEEENVALQKQVFLKVELIQFGYRYQHTGTYNLPVKHFSCKLRFAFISGPGSGIFSPDPDPSLA